MIPNNLVQVKCLACCAHQRLLFQHIHKFLLCKDVRPSKRSLFHCPRPNRCHSCLPISVYAGCSNVSENRWYWIYQNLQRTARFQRRTGGYLVNSNSPTTKGEIIRNRLLKLVASTLKIYEVDAHISHPRSNAQPSHVVQGRRTKDSICGWYTSKISTLCLSRWIQHFCTATQFSSS